MNLIYLTYQDYLDKHQNDFNEYQSIYPGATFNDFKNDLKRQYEVFDFKNKSVNIITKEWSSDIVRTISIYEFESTFKKWITHFEDIILSFKNQDEFIDKLFLEKNIIDVFEPGFNIISYPFNRIGFEAIIVMFDLTFCEKSIKVRLNEQKFKNLEFTFKKIFEQPEQPETTNTDINQDIDNIYESAKKHKSGKTILNQQQVVLLGKLIQEHMFEYNKISNIRLAKGLDIIFDYSHNNIRDGLGYTKKPKLNNEQLDELSEILNKITSDIANLRKK